MLTNDAKRLIIDVQKRWHSDPRVGTFQEIVKEFNLPPEDIASYIRHSIQRNPTKTGYLKKRHVQIVEALRGEGLGEEKIAECLTNIEGFPISPGILKNIENLRLSWKSDPELFQNKKKLVCIDSPNLELFVINNHGYKQTYAKILINGTDTESKIEFIEDSGIRFLSPIARRGLVKKCAQLGFGAKKIVHFLSEYQGFPAADVGRELAALRELNEIPVRLTANGSHNLLCEVRVEEGRFSIFTHGQPSEMLEVRGEVLIQTQVVPSEASQSIESFTPIDTQIKLRDRVREEWHNNPSLCSGRDICNRNKITPEQLKTLLGEKQNREIYKPVHVEMLKEMRHAGLSDKKIAAAFTEIEGFPFARNTVNNMMEKLRAAGDLDDERAKATRGWRVTGDALEIHDEGDASFAYKIPFDKMQEQANELVNSTHEEGETIVPDPSFTIYVRTEYMIIPKFGAINEVARRAGKTEKEIRGILEGGHKIKPIHMHLFKRLHENHVSYEKMAEVFREIEHIPLQYHAIIRTLEKMRDDHFLNNTATDRNVDVVVGDGGVQVVRNDGDLQDDIPLKDIESADNREYAKYLKPPLATAEQVRTLCNDAVKKMYCDYLLGRYVTSFQHIVERSGLSPPVAKAFVLHKMFHGDEQLFKQKLATTGLTNKQKEKIDTLARLTEYTLTQIAAESGCDPSTAAQHAFKVTFLGNQDLYNNRFHPPPITPAERTAVLQCSDDRWEFTSIGAIARKLELNYYLVRGIILEDKYGGDEKALVADYPGYRRLAEKEKTIIIEKIHHTKDNAAEIADDVGCGESAVRGLAFWEVYDGDYDRYKERFPGNVLDEDTRDCALLLIKYRGPRALNKREIVAKLAKEGKLICICVLDDLIEEAYPDTIARHERFPSDQQKDVGQVTHVICEESVKADLRRQGIEAFSEVTDWVPANKSGTGILDLVIPVTPAQLASWMERAGVEGMSMMEELGLNPKDVAQFEEVLLDFGPNPFEEIVQEKVDKYAKNGDGQPKKKRLVLMPITGTWFGDLRVRPAPDGMPNTRVVNLPFLADFCHLDATKRAILREAHENTLNLDYDAQVALRDRIGARRTNNTIEYWTKKIGKVPDFRTEGAPGETTIDQHQQNDGQNPLKSGAVQGPRQSGSLPLREKVQMNTGRGASVALDNLQAALAGARDNAAELGDALTCLEKGPDAPQEDTEEGPDRELDPDPEDNEAKKDQDRNHTRKASDPTASDAIRATDKSPELANTETKHVFPISDAERAAMIAAANEIARVPFKIDEKKAVPISDAALAEMFVAANATACKDFPLDLPELDKDKHEQNVEEIHVDGMQDASNTQGRGSRGLDSRRAR